MFSSTRSRLLLLVFALVPLACRREAPGAPVGSVLDAGFASYDAGAPSLPELQIRLSVPGPDGSTSTELLSAGSPLQIAPTSRLVLEINQPLRNYRVRLFDELDKIVPSDDLPEELSDRLLYSIDLLSPLRPGHRYALVLDAQSGPSMLDAYGRPVSERRYVLQLAGKPERLVSAASKTKLNRRRRHWK